MGCNHSAIAMLAMPPQCSSCSCHTTAQAITCTRAHTHTHSQPATEPCTLYLGKAVALEGGTVLDQGSLKLLRSFLVQGVGCGFQAITGPQVGLLCQPQAALLTLPEGLRKVPTRQHVPARHRLMDSGTRPSCGCQQEIRLVVVGGSVAVG